MKSHKIYPKALMLIGYICTLNTILSALTISKVEIRNSDRYAMQMNKRFIEFNESEKKALGYTPNLSVVLKNLGDDDLMEVRGVEKNSLREIEFSKVAVKNVPLRGESGTRMKVNRYRLSKDFSLTFFGPTGPELINVSGYHENTTLLAVLEKMISKTSIFSQNLKSNFQEMKSKVSPHTVASIDQQNNTIFLFNKPYFTKEGELVDGALYAIKMTQKEYDNFGIEEDKD
jgi:hypothetical protein